MATRTPQKDFGSGRPADGALAPRSPETALGTIRISGADCNLHDYLCVIKGARAGHRRGRCTAGTVDKVRPLVGDDGATTNIVAAAAATSILVISVSLVTVDARYRIPAVAILSREAVHLIRTPLLSSRNTMKQARHSRGASGSYWRPD